MLTLPVLVGWILRLRAGQPLTPALLAIAFCWVVGYLAFNAVSLLFKAPPNRRRAPRIATLTWAGAALGFGGLALWLGGVDLLNWAVIFAPLSGGAVWLAARRRERSVLSGGLTVAAAAMMTLVSRFGPMPAFLASLGTPTGTTAWLHAALVFGYLFGTVLHVKTMIRERGKRSWVLLSLGWHTGSTVAVAVVASLGLLSWAWVILFAGITLRAWLLPRLAARRPVRPLVVGLVEIGICTAVLLLTALA